MRVSRATRVALVAIATLAFCACATRPPPDVRGHWSDVNRYSDSPQPIALNPAQTFYATPLDRTLKGLLERWARDSHLALAYETPYDYTLHRPVAGLRSDSLHAALASLAALYAAERLSMAVEGDRIVVRPAGTSAAAAPNTDVPSAPAR